MATIGMNIAYLPLIAKLTWWMVSDLNQNTPTAAIASKSLGDISVSFEADTSDLDGRFGVPRWAVIGLPRYASGH